ncbi:hypothetical protein BJV78DRAFT_1210855 [Lactifluus subvellereus]|nr:hypothetical protein BJV78DRAFT_1210855 [Lactifluus subvellereus]
MRPLQVARCTCCSCSIVLAKAAPFAVQVKDNKMHSLQPRDKIHNIVQVYKQFYTARHWHGWTHGCLPWVSVGYCGSRVTLRLELPNQRSTATA